MVRAAVLASGDGARLQAILDAVYFNEIPNFELVAVLCPQRDCYAVSRAHSAGIPVYVVDPDLFPNMTSHSMAVANKLKDMFSSSNREVYAREVILRPIFNAIAENRTVIELPTEEEYQEELIDVMEEIYDEEEAMKEAA